MTLLRDWNVKHLTRWLVPRPRHQVRHVADVVHQVLCTPGQDIRHRPRQVGRIFNNLRRKPAVATAGLIDAPQPVGVALRQVDQAERQVLCIAGQCARYGLQHVRFRAYRAKLTGQIAQGGDPAFADHPLGRFHDSAQHTGDGPVIIRQRAVGERVVCLLGIAAALKEQQQPFVPCGLSGSHHGLHPRSDILPDLRPHLVGGATKRQWVLDA